METAEFAQLIKTRRSIRSWQDKPVKEAQLLQAVELAGWAPSGGNKQGWRFYVVMNKSVINAIADTIQASMSTILSWMSSLPPESRWEPPAGGEKRQRKAMVTASALIIVAATREYNDAQY